MEANPLSYQSIHTYIPTLQSRGVTVEFDKRTPRPPLKVSGDDQWGTPDAALEHPFIVEVRDQKGEVFAGVPVTFAITAGGGTLSATSTTTDENGRAQSTLTLGSDPGTDTVEVSVEGIAEMVTFTALAEIEFHLSVPAGISLIHVPLNVTSIDGAAKPSNLSPTFTTRSVVHQKSHSSSPTTHKIRSGAAISAPRTQAHPPTGS